MLIASQVWTAGQVVGLIHDVPTCADLLERIQREALISMRRVRSVWTGTEIESKI